MPQVRFRLFPYHQQSSAHHSCSLREAPTLDDDSDVGKNFEVDIDAVSGTEASDSEDSSSNELKTFWTILSVPRPEAPMHKVHKASTIIWLSYYQY
jgi:hypothetical protein